MRTFFNPYIVTNHRRSMDIDFIFNYNAANTGDMCVNSVPVPDSYIMTNDSI